MADGIIADLDELIALRRYAQAAHYHPLKTAQRAGNHDSKRRGRGMDFSEVRNYQAGDEIRHMEWRVTARTGRPHVKIYHEERERPVIIAVDFNPSMYFGTRIAFKSVLAARLAALLAWTVVKQGDRVGGLFFSATEHHEFMPRGRDSAVLALLASLSDYTHPSEHLDQEPPQQLSKILQRLRRVMRPGSILYLISDFYAFDAACAKQLQHLKPHHDILAYHICDPLELAPPKPQQYAITNGQQEIIFDTRSFAIVEAYTQYCLDRVDSLQKQFKNLGISYQQVTAATDLRKLIHQGFLRRSHG